MSPDVKRTPGVVPECTDTLSTVPSADWLHEWIAGTNIASTARSVRLQIRCFILVPLKSIRTRQELEWPMQSVLVIAIRNGHGCESKQQYAAPQNNL